MNNKKIIVIIMCLMAVFTAGCSKSKENEKKEEKKGETNILYAHELYDTSKFDASKFDGKITKNDEVIDIKALLDSKPYEDEVVLIDNVEDVWADEIEAFETNMGQPSSVCESYGMWDNKITGSVYKVWEYNDYYIEIYSLDWRNWKKYNYKKLRTGIVTAIKKDKFEKYNENTWGYNDIKKLTCYGKDLLQ